MNKQIAEEIVNQIPPRGLSALREYCILRIESAKTRLAHAQNMEEVRKEQGLISAFEEIKLIRDFAVNYLKSQKD